jgi:hypothetical protein
MKLIFKTLLSVFILLVMGTTAPALSAELNQAAVDGFNRYSQVTEQKMNDQIQGGDFLSIDMLPADERNAAYARLRRGDVLTEKREIKENGQEIKTPNAMIHDWISTIFVPEVNLRQVKTFFQDYENMPDYYHPEVVRSKILSQKGNYFKIYIRMRVEKILTFVFNTTQDVHYKQLDNTHLISISDATRIAEVENAGTPKEHELPVGNDRGLLWGSKTYWRAVEKDGGVYVQCESLTLTRDIPAVVKPLVTPFLNSTPKELLETMMTDLRKGAESSARAMS